MAMFSSASREISLKKHLARVANGQNDPFTALNTAFFNHGAYIKVAEKKEIKQPIILYHLWDQQANYVQTRHLMVVEPESRCQVIEIFKGVDDAFENFHNTVTEVVVEESAHFDYHKIQTECGNNIHVGYLHWPLHWQSSLNPEPNEGMLHP